MCEVVGISGVIPFTSFLYQPVYVGIEVYLTCIDEKESTGQTSDQLYS